MLDFEFSDDGLDNIELDIQQEDLTVVQHDRVLRDPTSGPNTAIGDFVQNAQQRYLDYMKKVNTAAPAESSDPIHSSSPYAQDGYIQKYPDHNYLQEQYNIGYTLCSPEQQACLNNIEMALTRRRNRYIGPEELIMFMSGAGGTGKSHVINLSGLLAKLIIGKTRGMFGPQVNLGPTGSSANGIKGFTFQSVLGMCVFVYIFQ